jgi:hypothetical protein
MVLKVEGDGLPGFGVQKRKADFRKVEGEKVDFFFLIYT